MDVATHKKNFKITFGKPNPYETFMVRFNLIEWTRLVKDHVYELAEDPHHPHS